MTEEKDLLEQIEAAIAALKYPRRATGLYRPVAYTLAGGGKRLRPMLVLMACEAVGGEVKDAINQALAIEMFHNFTLIHDDVMDRSARRRGRPTVYRRWGDVQAILSGDALLTMAYMRLCDCAQGHEQQLLALFNRTALEVYEGQQLDTEFEHRDGVTVDEYIEMIRLKTSVLLGAACAMGAIMGGADEATVDAMYRYGEALGLAFQLRDDWLDVYGDPAVFGKNIGNDIITRKKTWLLIRATELAGDRIESAYQIQGVTGRVVAGVKAVYDSLGLSQESAALISKYALDAMNALPANLLDGYRERFVSLAIKLNERSK